MWKLASGVAEPLAADHLGVSRVFTCLSRASPEEQCQGCVCTRQREIYYAELLTLVVMRADKSQDRSWQAELGPGQVAVPLQLSAH